MEEDYGLDQAEMNYLEQEVPEPHVQGCGNECFFSVLDPDPHGAAFSWLSRIRIRIGNADPGPEAQKLTKI
jgi:hypothetical protein